MYEKGLSCHKEWGNTQRNDPKLVLMLLFKKWQCQSLQEIEHFCRCLQKATMFETLRNTHQ